MIKSCKATNHAQQPRSRGQGDSPKETTLESKSGHRGKRVQLWQRKPGKEAGIQIWKRGDSRPKARLMLLPNKCELFFTTCKYLNLKVLRAQTTEHNSKGGESH